MRRSVLRTLLALAVPVACASSLLAAPAFANVPTNMHLEGVLQSAAGGPAADGTYAVDFALYDKESGGTALWTEAKVAVVVKNGLFTYVLGTSKPLSSDVIAQANGLWLGLKVADEPELPRRPFGSVAYALVAQQALAVACSGCIGSAQIAPDVLKPLAKSSDLSKIATSGQYADLQGAPTLAKVATTGQYGDLAGVPDLNAYAKSASLHKVAQTGSYKDLADLPALADVAATGEFKDLKNAPVVPQVGKSCGSGLVIKGFKADGSLECVVAMDPTALPKDGLDEISNGLLSNQFTEVVPSANPFDIKDNTPTGTGQNLDVPDLGLATKLTVSVDLSNSDVSGVTVKLYDPDNVEYVLYDKGKSGTALKDSWPDPTQTVKGDLTTWVGKNPKGKWSLLVIDSKYKDNGIDGKVNGWAVNVSTIGTTKVKVVGNLVLGGSTAECTVYHKGAIRYSDALAAIQVCDGNAWFPRLKGVVKEDPGVSCKTIKDEAPGAKSGTYWLDPDGSGSGAAFQAYCDQETGGGGWTLVAKVKGNDKTMNRINTAQWRQKQPIGGQDCASVKDENALCSAYDKVGFADVMIRSLSKPWRNLAWTHRDKYPSMWAVVDAGNRVISHARLFGAVHNLDYNGDPRFHRDCAGLAYGFLTADYNYNNTPGIAGHNIAHGHSGGVVGASLFDWENWAANKEYGKTDFLTTRCITDFGVGSGYYDAKAGNDDSYAINAHWWGNGNEYSWNWNSHGVFVR